jgi:hypothetical protein
MSVRMRSWKLFLTRLLTLEEITVVRPRLSRSEALNLLQGELPSYITR